MGSAAILGITMGALTAANALASSQQQAQQQKAQGSALQAQAAQVRQQASLEAQRGRVEAENHDRQKSALRREFQEAQGRNRSLLAAGNVLMDSGSARDVSLGNIDRFAADVGENAYQKALRQWETAQSVKNLDYQAATLDAQGSYLKKSAANLGTSLLTAGLTGLSAGLGTYGMAGGTFAGAGAGAGSGLSFGTWERWKKTGSVTHPATQGAGW